VWGFSLELAFVSLFGLSAVFFPGLTDLFALGFFSFPKHWGI